MADLRVTGVDLDGVLTLLGHHLYTTPAVAVRELVQNAHDSIVRRRLVDPSFDGGAIRMKADPARRTLTVSDDGTGMNADEIQSFLATIGAGATRDARTETGSDELIGMFGIGFLSAFVIGRRVTVETTSHHDTTSGWMYQSSGGRQYTLRPIEPGPPGSVVVVDLNDDAALLGQPESLAQIAKRYCALLHLPVYLGADTEPINVTPPWRRPPEDGGVTEHPVAAARARREFAANFEPLAPLCTIDVAPSEDCDAKGLLWVQGSGTYGALDNRNISVFLRGMLLDDEARDLLPRWAGFMGGVVESSRLSPTASREDLQRDEHWYALRESLSRQVVHGLAQVAAEEPEAWRRVLRRHNELLLGAAVADPRLFGLLADSLTVPTTEGDLRVSQIVQRSRGRIHVSAGEPGGFEETVFRAMKVPIATGIRYGVLPFVRQWGGERKVEVVELGTARGDRQVFTPAVVDAGELDWLTGALADPGDEIVPARFAPATLPLISVPDREVELKQRIESDEADARISQSALALARSHTAGIDGAVRRRLFVNLDSAAVKRLLELSPDQRSATAVSLLRSLKGLTAGTGAAGYDLDAALGEFTAALLDVLNGGT